MQRVQRVVSSMAPAAAKPKPAVTKIPAAALHLSRPTSWLESRFHFSFADWYGAGVKQEFGPLRVLNDDLVKAKSGFGAHPHSNAEIFSYVVKGELTHQDSMGNAEALPAGGVQFMSAGTGVVHSEMNNGAATCRFLQVWLTPDARGHEPQYGSLQTTPDQRRNRLLAILRGTGEPPAWHSATQHPAAPRLHQDAAVFVSQAEPGVSQEAVLEPGRQAYVVCIEGSLRVGGPEGEESLAAREAAELVAGARPLHVDLAAGEEGAHFMVIEMTQRPRRA